MGVDTGSELGPPSTVTSFYNRTRQQGRPEEPEAPSTVTVAGGLWPRITTEITSPGGLKVWNKLLTVEGSVSSSID